MANRRDVLLSAAGLALAGSSRDAFTAQTPTDATAAILLRPRIKSLDENLVSRADHRQVIAAQTPLIIEQNFARYDSGRLSRVLSNLTEDELQLMSVIYMGAVANYGIRPLLLDVLATRLSPAELGRISRHFGFAPVYEAVISHAPLKSLEFQRHSNPNFMAPGLWSPVPRPAAQRQVKFLFDESGPRYFKRATPTLDYTLYEVYLSYRTSPVGSLTVRAALYETAVFAGSRLAGAYYAGYAVGTGLSNLIQIYAPDLHDRIGGAIYNVVDWLSSAWATNNVSTIGYSQQNSSAPFSLGAYDNYFPTSSDYNITHEWNIMASGGGGGCGVRPEGCPILE